MSDKDPSTEQAFTPAQQAWTMELIAASQQPTREDNQVQGTEPLTALSSAPTLSTVGNSGVSSGNIGTLYIAFSVVIGCTARAMCALPTCKTVQQNK